MLGGVGGGPAPAFPAPAVPHNFTRLLVIGADNTMDYVATPSDAKAVKALPGLGWIIVPGAPGAPQRMAAPFLSLMGTMCQAASADWDDGLLAPMLGLSELLAEVTLPF